MARQRTEEWEPRGLNADTRATLEGMGHVFEAKPSLNVGKFLQRCKVNKAHLIRGFMIMSLAKLTLRFLPTAFKTRVEIHGWHTLFHETVVIRASEESLVRHRVRT